MASNGAGSERSATGSIGQNQELKALVSLIDEPDPGNYHAIRERILAYGLEAIPELEAMLDRHFGESVQDRVLNLIHEIQYDDIYRSLRAWIADDSHDLLKGFFIVSRYQYPNLDDGEIRSRIDQITRDVWLEINDDLTALEKVKVINHVLFDIHGFVPNRSDLHNPSNFFINTLLETRKGSPLSLGILYILVSQKLDIPVYGVNLPQHFILAYGQGYTVDPANVPGPEDVLFYVNPFNRGAVFTRNEIELFIRHSKLQPEPAFYSPCSNKVIIRRLLTNLIFAYEQLQKKEKAGELGRLLGLLEHPGAS